MILTLDAKTKNSDFPEQFSNHLYYSEDVSLDNFTYESVYSLKYAITGFEQYLVNGKVKKLKAGEFLVVNHQSEVTSMPSAGLASSIFIDPQTMRDVYSNLIRTDKELLSHPEAGRADPHFWSDVFSVKTSGLGQRLVQLGRQLATLHTLQEQQIDEHFFFQLSEDLLYSQQESLREMKGLEVVNRITREECYRRILIGRDFIHSNLDESLHLEDIARVAMLSPFHFHRLFKAAFLQTPSQYQQHLLMARAGKWIKNRILSIKEISLNSGYSDVSAFGKAFKRYSGYSPRTYRDL